MTRTTEEISAPDKVRKTYASLSSWKRKKKLVHVQKAGNLWLCSGDWPSGNWKLITQVEEWGINSLEQASVEGVWETSGRHSLLFLQIPCRISSGKECPQLAKTFLYWYNLVSYLESSYAKVLCRESRTNANKQLNFMWKNCYRLGEQKNSCHFLYSLTFMYFINKYVWYT